MSMALRYGYPVHQFIKNPSPGDSRSEFELCLVVSERVEKGVVAKQLEAMYEADSIAYSQGQMESGEIIQVIKELDVDEELA